MKEIWINLELYIKRYDFYNFRDFFLDFSYFSDLKNNKNNKKRARGARVDATWYARPRGSATRTRAARHVARLYILYIFLHIV